jgi:hypothetical protein
MPETTFHATTQKRWTAFLRTFNAPNDPCVEPRDAAALEPQITFEDAAVRMRLLPLIRDDAVRGATAFQILQALGIIPQQLIKTRMCVASCFGLKWVSLREAQARSTGCRVQFDLGPEKIGDFRWPGPDIVAAHIMTLAYARQLRLRTPEETAYALSAMAGSGRTPTSSTCRPVPAPTIRTSSAWTPGARRSSRCSGPAGANASWGLPVRMRAPGTSTSP